MAAGGVQRPIRRWLLPGIALAAAAIPASRTLWQCLGWPRPPLTQLDFTLYYATAVQALRAGWHHLYDLEVQRAIHRTILPGLWWFPNVYTPALSLLLVPFTLIPVQQAFWLWEWIQCGSFGFSAFALAPGTALSRAAHLALAIVPYPVALGLGMGQVLALQMGALALAMLLLRRGRDIAAGAALTAIALKPQGMLLVPFALLAAGKRKSFAAWLVCSTALSLALLALIGFDGATAYFERLRYAQSHPHEFWVAWSYTLPRHFPNPAARTLVQLAAALGALVAAWRHRKVEIAVAAGLLGSLLASPFLHLDDLMLLFPAGWLVLRVFPPAAAPLAVCYGLLLLCTHDGAFIWGRWVLLFECLWLAALAVAPARLLERRGASPELTP